MKKRLVSIFLSVTLVFQIGAVPQISAKHTNNSIDRAVPSVVQNENSRDLNSKIIRALKYVGGTALTVTGLYFVYNYLRPRPEIIEPVPDAPVQPVVVPDVPVRPVVPGAPVQPVVVPDAPVEPVVVPVVPVVPDAGPIDYIPLANAVHPSQVITLEQRISDFEAFLDRYLNNDLIQQDEIEQICNDAITVLERESSLLRIEGSTIVVGDIHGNIGSLEYSISKFLGEVRNGKSILFLGDYVDKGEYAPRGPNSIKNVALLFKLKTMFPDKVFLLRGNHEDKGLNYYCGFFAECEKVYGNGNGNNVYTKFNEVFDYLSLAAVVDNTTFCVHGGISSELHSLHQIHDIKKPSPCNQIHNTVVDYNVLAVDLLWSDPNLGIGGFRPNERGAGCEYGHDVSQEFLTRHSLRHILRAHQRVEGHDDVFGDNSVITLFSAPDYYIKDGNIGEIAEIDGDDIRYERIRYNIK